MLGEGGGTMSQEEIAGAEAPKDADARQAAVAGCLDINVAVADVDDIRCLRVVGRRMMGNAQLAQSFENSIGSGLLTDTLCFMFTNSDIDIRKEMPDKGLCGSHHLIAHYRQLAPSGLEFMKQFVQSEEQFCGPQICVPAQFFL